MAHLEFLSKMIANKFFLVFIALCIPIILSIRTYPVMILLVSRKRLMDDPVGRSTHTARTPTLGGIVLFIAFSITLIVLALFTGLPKLSLLDILAILAGTIMLMFIGVKDDLIGISPKKKFGIQTFAAAIVVILTDLRITYGYGILGIEEFPYVLSVLLTVFVFLLVINAFNLIDGLDGLAGTIGIITSVAFGIFHIINDRISMILISFVLIGSLLGFLRFNLSSKRKIFMGDSGSMFVGFLLAYQAVSFLNYHSATFDGLSVKQAPIMVLAILSFPLLDTLRVFIIRIYQKRSPFSADRNHIHHKLLDMQFTHIQASLILGSLNIMVILLAVLIRDLYINLQLYILVIAVPLIYVSPKLFVRKEGKIAFAVPQNIRKIMVKAGFFKF